MPNRDQYHAWFERDAMAFTELIHSRTWARSVPSCPGWSMRDLVEHLGAVHRWARDAIVLGRPNDMEEPAVGDDLVDWFAAGAGELLALLRASDHAAQAWTFGPHPRTVSFWDRRQALEISLHLWDARNASGAPNLLDAELAADGVAEVVEIMYPRQVRLNRIAPLPYAIKIVVAGDPQTQHVLGGSGSDPKPVATLTGPAPDLLLVLWGRGDRDRLAVTGDGAAVTSMLAGGVTP